MFVLGIATGFRVKHIHFYTSCMHACMHSKKDCVVATIVILVASVNS